MANVVVDIGDDDVDPVLGRYSTDLEAVKTCIRVLKRHWDSDYEGIRVVSTTASGVLYFPSRCADWADGFVHIRGDYEWTHEAIRYLYENLRFHEIQAPRAFLQRHGVPARCRVFLFEFTSELAADWFTICSE